MDEPTNHLDVEMVEMAWNIISAKKKFTLFCWVTHDRYFLDNVCTEIWELDGSTLTEYKGDYQNYLERKQRGLKVISPVLIKQNILIEKGIRVDAEATKSKNN